MSSGRRFVIAGFASTFVVLGCAWGLITGSVREVGTLSTTAMQAPTLDVSVAGVTTTAVPTTAPLPEQLAARSELADELAAPTTIPVEDRRSVRIAATGDLLIHGPVRRALATGSNTYDFRPAFEFVADELETADLAICHLETPITPDNRRVSSYPSFNVPTELAFAIADAGFDTCSTASNHSLDAGVDGIAATLDLLDDAGVDHVGTARDADEAAALVLYEAGDVTIGHGSYSYWFNGYKRPEDKLWAANPIDREEIIRHSQRLREAGAEIVIMSIHWGLEYQVDPIVDQVDLAEQLMAEPTIDLIIGHHAHVVQPVDVVNDKLVVYGLGNFLSAQSSQCCGIRSEEGVIVGIDFTEEPDGTMTFDSVDAMPTWVDRSSYRIVPSTPSIDMSEGQRARVGTAAERVIEALNRRLPEKNLVSERQ